MKKRIIVSSAVMTVFQLFSTAWDIDQFPMNLLANQLACVIWFAVVFAITGKIINGSPERSHKVAMYFRIVAGGYAATQGIPMLVYTLVKKKPSIAETDWYYCGIMLVSFINLIVTAGILLSFLPAEALSIASIVNFVLCIVFAVRSENDRPHL